MEVELDSVPLLVVPVVVTVPLLDEEPLVVVDTGGAVRELLVTPHSTRFCPWAQYQSPPSASLQWRYLHSHSTMIARRTRPKHSRSRDRTRLSLSVWPVVSLREKQLTSRPVVATRLTQTRIIAEQRQRSRCIARFPAGSTGIRTRPTRTARTKLGVIAGDLLSTVDAVPAIQFRSRPSEELKVSFFQSLRKPEQEDEHRRNY